MQVPNIRPVSDLRNHYGELMDDVHKSNEPVFLTRNGVGDAVLMSIDAYKTQQKRDDYQWEVYYKLKEAEEQAKIDPRRYSHEEIWSRIDSHLKETASYAV
jgi:prevent-host-death family protein